MQLWDDGECRPTGPSGPGILHLISNSECDFPKRKLASFWVSIIPDTLFIEHLLCAQIARCPGRSRVQDRQGFCLQIPPPALGWALASLDEQHTGPLQHPVPLPCSARGEPASSALSGEDATQTTTLTDLFMDA